MLKDPSLLDGDIISVPAEALLTSSASNFHYLYPTYNKRQGKIFQCYPISQKLDDPES